MALPTGMLPKTEERLRRQGLWNEPMCTSRYDPASWEGACEDGVTMTFGHCLTEVLQPGRYVWIGISVTSVVMRWWYAAICSIKRRSSAFWRN